MRLNILYRGPLESCNYHCRYCPFAKRTDSREQLDKDCAALERFVQWVGAQCQEQMGVLFTPWGEGLIRGWYRRALVDLTHFNHVERASIQTNLSGPIEWIGDCRLDRLALWATFHPSEVPLDAFVAKVHRLHDCGVRLSVGIVALREHFSYIRAVRDALPASVYLWINAYDRLRGKYTPDEVQELTRIDPYFPINNARHASRGEPCRAGETSFTVDGDGMMRRCHFVNSVLGNIYSDHWRDGLQPRTCPNKSCSCHIGYVHLESLSQEEIYGQNVLERIPLA